MTSFRQGGNRRIDRVLDPDFLNNLVGMPMDDLRDRRRQAEQEEVNHSYVRRLLQGRIDILRAEQARRSAGGTDNLLEHLAKALSDDAIAPAPAHGLGRHIAVEPSAPGAHRRSHEAVLDDVSLSDVQALSDEQLLSTLETFTDKERAVSTQRRAIQGIMDSCSDEIGRRYRDGEADVTNLLAGGQH